MRDHINNEFPGLIVKPEKTYSFIVSPCPEKHAGLGRVLINYKKRDNSRRFDIVRITTPKGKFAHAAVIGHYRDPQHIKMDYDLRNELGLSNKESVYLEIEKCGLFGSTIWYLTSRDPLVKVPALLATGSILIGILGLLIAFFD